MENTEHDLPLDSNDDENPIADSKSQKDSRYNEGSRYNEDSRPYDDSRHFDDSEHNNEFSEDLDFSRGNYDDHKDDNYEDRNRSYTQTHISQLPIEGNQFFMSVSGQILSGEFKDIDGLAVKYVFVSKGEWLKTKGNETGISQHSFKSSNISKRVIWNFPFEIRYKSNTMKDWPQLVIYCSGKDFAGREVMYGYGSIHIPTVPGRHTKTIKMFQPFSSSLLTRVSGWIRGKNSEYRDAPAMIAKAEGRALTRVKGSGSIKVSFQVTQKDF